MIDFHNHVLPNVDDGPKTMEESMSMVRYAAKQGITEIVQTVHFQHPKMDGKNVEFDYLDSKVKKLQSQIDKQKLNVKIHLSAEVFYLPNLIKISSNPLVTVGGGKYMLIEFATSIFPEGYETQFYNLQLNGITPIVAHPERYRFVQNDIEIIKSWIERGYVIQIDAGSILGNFGKKTKEVALKIINKGYIHLIGSDAHNNKKRNFCIKSAYDFLEDNIDISIIKDNAKKILIGEGNINNIQFLKKNKTSSIMSKIFKLLYNS